MNKQALDATRALCAFIAESPTANFAAHAVCRRLEAAGFTEYYEHSLPDVVLPGTCGYVMRGDSTVLAFRMPAEARGFSVLASHSDSPGFRLKSHNMQSAAGCTRLATERYGGMRMAGWFDRPLSLAGRAVVRQEGRLVCRDVRIDRDLCIIPSLAIHMDREANSGRAFNAAKDMLPVYAASVLGEDQSPEALAAQTLGVARDQVVSVDLYLYDRTPAAVLGPDDSLFAAPRIDNLMCAYGTLEGFLQARAGKNCAVYALFDHEEVGSTTSSGAASDFLERTLGWLAKAGMKCDLATVLPRSMMLSADNAHAVHPNYPEYSDANNAPHMNGGPVIKVNANRRYATDVLGVALMKEICSRAGVPVQVYENRSDLTGGSTLGSIASGRVSMLTIDMGMAQLAMHSAYETAGTADTAYLISAACAFAETAFEPDGAGVLLQ